jgi:hypothetical protein
MPIPASLVVSPELLEFWVDVFLGDNFAAVEALVLSAVDWNDPTDVVSAREHRHKTKSYLIGRCGI